MHLFSLYSVDGAAAYIQSLITWLASLYDRALSQNNTALLRNHRAVLCTSSVMMQQSTYRGLFG